METSEVWRMRRNFPKEFHCLVKVLFPLDRFSTRKLLTKTVLLLENPKSPLYVRPNLSTIYRAILSRPYGMSGCRDHSRP